MQNAFEVTKNGAVLSKITKSGEVYDKDGNLRISSGGVTFTPASGVTFSEGACYRIGDIGILEGCLTVPNIAGRTWLTVGSFDATIEHSKRTIAFKESGIDRIIVQTSSNGINVFNVSTSDISGSFFVLVVFKIIG